MITLVLGGASSGKSVVAERLAASLVPPVTYVATWTGNEDDDADMAARVALHRARRPREWTTVVAGEDLPSAVAGAAGTLLIDALGTWVAGAPGLSVDVDGLCRALAHRDGDVVVVSDEVGLGVHPSTDVGRRFRDAVGDVNVAVGEVADRVWFVVAGHVLALTPPPGGAAS